MINRILIGLLLLVLIGCQPSGQEQAENTTEEIVELPEDFLAFYDRFHTDSLFQLEHIAFPLPGKPASGDFNIELTDVRWQRDGWVLHRPFDEDDDTFDQQFVLFNEDIITEYIYSPAYGYYMERRWARLTDGWNLIYFADLQEPAQREE